MALRTLPVVLDVAAAVAARSASDAWLIDFTNPVGIVTQALSDLGSRVVGLCNVAINMERRIAERLGVAPDRLSLDYAGLNHLSWVGGVVVDGVDRMPEVVDLALADPAESELASIISALGVYPSPYLRYYYQTDLMLEQQRTGAARASAVATIEAELLAAYADHGTTSRPAALSLRGGSYYSEAALRLIASIRSDKGDIQVVNVRNGRAIPELSEDAIVEIPARIFRGGPEPLQVGPIPTALRGLVQHVKAYEELTIRAARTADRAIALQALLANPLVASVESATSILDEYLHAHRGHLPAAWGRSSR